MIEFFAKSEVGERWREKIGGLVEFFAKFERKEGRG
jgi:hypothetical protein